MRRITSVSILLALSAACTKAPMAPVPTRKAFGTVLVSVSGDKQAAGVGATLDQPLVVQVNDAKGAPVAGALVRFTGAGGMTMQPDQGLTGPDGQFTTSVTLGGMSGRYQIAATTVTPAGKPFEIRIDEIALGYQAMLGAQINQIHCIRCHDSESTPERVSNHDNLEAAPHGFTEGAILNSMSDTNLVAIIAHGGIALHKSAAMPPYGDTLTKTEIDALVAYLRAVSDPAYRTQGVFYASN